MTRKKKIVDGKTRKNASRVDRKKLQAARQCNYQPPSATANTFSTLGEHDKIQNLETFIDKAHERWNKLLIKEIGKRKPKISRPTKKSFPSHPDHPHFCEACDL